MAIEIGDGVIRFRGDYSQVQSSLQKAAPAMRQVGVVAAAAGAAITAGIGVAVKQAGSFEQAITNAASVTGKSGAEFEAARDKMSDLALTLGRTTVFSARECADAFYDLSSKGFDVAAMSVEELKPMMDLAAATQSDLTFSTETVTATLRAFGMENKETTRIADVFTKAIGTSAAKVDILRESMKYVAPVAKAAGVSFEETTSLVSQLANVGYEGSMAGTALRRAFSELMSPSDKLVKTLDRLGLTVDDVNLKNHTFAEVLGKLKQAGFTAADAMDIFGQRAGPTVASLLEVGDQAVKSFTESLNSAGGTAATVAEQQLQTFEGQMKLLKSAIEGFLIPVGKALLPALTQLATKVSEVFQALARWTEAHPGLTKVIVATAGAIGGLLLVGGSLLLLASQLIIAFVGLSTLLGGAAGVAGAAGAAGFSLTALAGTLGTFLLGAAGVAVGIVLIWKIIHAFVEWRRAENELAESEQRLTEQRKRLKEQEERLLDDEMHQRTGFSERAIGLIHEQVEAESGAQIDREKLVERIKELNADHSMSVTDMVNTIAGELQQQKGDIKETESVWSGAMAGMQETTRQYSETTIMHISHVRDQIYALRLEVNAMGGHSWWVDAFNRMAAATTTWRKGFEGHMQAATHRIVQLGSVTRSLGIGWLGRGGESSYMNTFRSMPDFTAGRGFGIMEVPSQVDISKLGGGGGASGGGNPVGSGNPWQPNVTVSGNTFVVRTEDDVDAINKGLAEQIREALRQSGQRLSTSRV